MHLQCCLTLSHTWDANLPTVTILWEYYSKNLVSKHASYKLELYKGICHLKEVG